ncbi:hypothetical protein [Caenispirillum salinarum]|uniref:hypothetical protein n=1 Tax=Caenispirillum salinarum TaxID=859058 RepID=UPI00384B5D57
MRKHLFLLLAAALLLPTVGAKAGEVMAFASTVNGVIRGDIEPAAPGAVVTVTGPDGTVLGETTMDEAGAFTFTPSRAVDHTFAADLGEGLVARLTVPAEDIAAASAPAPEDLRALIAEAVEAQVRPLRRDLLAYKDSVGLMDALGGLGYIFGIFGVAAWIMSRRRPAA